MKLQEACTFLENLELISVNILDSEKSIEDFCSKYKIHPSQSILTPQVISQVIAELDSTDFILLSDAFKINYLFALYENTPIAYGPYCTQLLSTEEVSLLMLHLNIKDIAAEAVARQRSLYPVKPQQNVQYYLNILLSTLTGDPSIRNTKTIDYLSVDYNDEDEIEERDLNITLARDHYEKEQLLIDSIAKGDFDASLAAWRQLHNAVSFRKIGHTLEIAKISAGITRTLLRVGAIKAGLPPEINDHISGNSSQIISRARTIDAINIEHERLIKEYCEIIKEYASNNYSGNILSAKLYIEDNYMQAIKVEDLASEFSYSSSQFIRKFKEEVGLTPISYLNKYRMTKAAYELSHSAKSIQEISENVGIYDPNYFVKCFKKEFDCTPNQYRKNHF